MNKKRYSSFQANCEGERGVGTFCVAVIIGGGLIGVCKSADPLKSMAESVDPLKKSTKSESANFLPRWMIRETQSDFSCWSCLA